MESLFAPELNKQSFPKSDRTAKKRMIWICHFAVTKLLKLKELRTDVQQDMLVILKACVKGKAKLYTDIQALKNIDEQLKFILVEAIIQMIENSKSQSRTMKNYFRGDIFQNVYVNI